MADSTETAKPTAPVASLQDQTLLIFARLMEGGQEDEDTCKELDQLTKLLNDDAELQTKDKSHTSICKVIDGDCVDTVLCYLDMRQPAVVRGHATLTTSAYMKAAGVDGAKALTKFFLDRIGRGTYDDYIVAFCVASVAFPIVPDLASELFLGEGFLGSLGSLMRREWKSKKVETACLEMLNTACMDSKCRQAIEKYCVDWLEEIVDQDTKYTKSPGSELPKKQGDEGSISMRQHSEQVQYLAAVILAKLRAVPSQPTAEDGSRPRIESAVTGIEELSGLFTKMIIRDEDHGRQHSIEGLAYASLQPKIKENIIRNPELLKKLIKTLEDTPSRSPTTYGALSIFLNLTRYRPAFTEEEKKMTQLKAYADAAGKLATPDELDDDAHVAKRCKTIFDLGLVPVLVAQSKSSSPGALVIIVTIILSLSIDKTIRGKLAQQGAVPLLIGAWAALQDTNASAARTASQALARILISIDPNLVFGGNRPTPVNAAIRPLISILPTDPAADRQDLLPTFESLMALTNLASMNDEETRQTIIRTAWPHIEEQLLSSNHLVSKAAVELICNLVQSPEGVALYADGSHQASQRLHILLALSDAEDEATRSAAGGAIASLTGFETVVRGIVHRERGVKVVLGLCSDSDEGLRHRGVVIILNMASTEGEIGEEARRKIEEENGVNILKECLKSTRRPEVIHTTVQALKIFLGSKENTKLLE